jgi:peptidoglycan-associated lipoprotein
VSKPVLNWVLTWSAGLLSLALLASCAAPPPPPAAASPAPSKSYVVLLSNSDGSTGQIKLTTAAGETVLAKAGQASLLNGPPGQSFEVSRAKIAQDFGAAMDARPAKPVSFLLYFLPGGAQLAPESVADINKVLAEIAARPVPDVSIIGHTDTAGDDATNERLGLERARYVAGLLASANLNPRNVSVESHGEKNLLVPTADNTNEPRNRRVEITVR